MRRVLRIEAFYALAATCLFAAAASADTLDQSGVSQLIEATAQEIGQPFQGVHIQIVDPSDHLRAGTADGAVSFDIPSLLNRIDRQTSLPLGFDESRRVGRHAAFAFFHREMATSLHALSDGSTLCIVFPMSAPVRLSALAAMLSGNSEATAGTNIEFDAADFYRFLLYHEVAHCSEDARRVPTRGLGPYEIYLAESRADAFAVLMHMRRTGSHSLPRFMAAVRREGMKIRGDVEHQTAAVIEPTTTLATDLHLTGTLAGTSALNLMRAARTMTAEYALGLKDFVMQNLLQAHRQRPLR